MSPADKAAMEAAAEKYWIGLNGPIGVTAHVTTIYKAGYQAAHARQQEKIAELISCAQELIELVDVAAQQIKIALKQLEEIGEK